MESHLIELLNFFKANWGWEGRLLHLDKVVSDWLKHKGAFFTKALGEGGDEQPHSAM